MYFELLKRDEEVSALILGANECMSARGYTEHGLRHTGWVSHMASHILEQLGYSEKDMDLVKCAGLLHDIGNALTRHEHGSHSAILAYPILLRIGMPYADAVKVTSAIANHEEQSGHPVNILAAALVIADKSDVNRSRVDFSKQFDSADIHDRVNFAVRENTIDIDKEARIINSRFTMEESASVKDFLEIYAERMEMCEKSAKVLNATFHLYINGSKIN